MPTRRQWLQSMVLLGTAPLHAWARPASAPLLAAAWAVGAEAFVGVLQLPDRADQALEILQSHAVPTRAHGMTPMADGSVLFASRRPGDWLLRLRPDQSAQWHWIEDDRAFNGHVIASHDQRHIYTTETDLADSQGLIGVRDAHTLEKIDEWRTGGMDPHQLLLDADGSLVVANGGIPTQPETGRRKLRLAHMDSSIARLRPDEQGRIAGQWKLTDPRLSLRHLAWGGPVAWNPQRRWLGIALQAEHTDLEQRRQAPVLALFDGQHLQAPSLPEGAIWEGYGGDISSDGSRFAVSCPRADTLSWWLPPSTPDGSGHCVATHHQQGVYSLSNTSVAPSLHSPHRGLWSGGEQQVQHWPQPRTVAQVTGMALDNHWVPL